ncbi:MAG: hypothetical protein IJ752_08865 [Alphaproteobacteria bacterium]|nr:hypothetical protein [Alphaproteobacteria bacterium]
MKKSFLILTLLCLVSVPAAAKDEMHKLEEKIAEIQQDFDKEIKKIESKSGLSADMKQLKLKQENEKKDLKIKQVQEKYELKTRQKSERKALKLKERQKAASDAVQSPS